MPVYLLRHEERDIDNPLFESPLTSHGEDHALALVNILQDKNINRIYSSPFLRTVQTIYPYCNHTQQKICIEHALYESMDSVLFNKKNCAFTWSHLPTKYQSIVNTEYKSKCGVVPLYETFDEVCQRVQPFVDILSEEHIDQNILCVTHLTVIHAIMQCLDQKKENHMIHMGDVVQVL